MAEQERPLPEIEDVNLEEFLTDIIKTVISTMKGKVIEIKEIPFISTG